MDRRISKTKKALKEALCVLMENKNYKDISITDLCEKANVNRGTFYLHYKTIDVFVKEMEDELISKLSKVILNHYPVKNYEYYDLCQDVADIIIEDKEFYSKLVGKNGDNNFVRQVGRYCKELTIRLNKFTVDEHDQQYMQFYVAFLVDGGIGVLIQWLLDGCKDDLTEIFKQFSKLIVKVIS